MARDPRSPAFQFYPKDWLADENVRAMNHRERGIYIDLIAAEWIEGSLPKDVARLARIVSLPKTRFTGAWRVIESCFSCHPDRTDRLVHPRSERERQAQRQRRDSQSEAGKIGAEKRWGRQKGGHGNPNGNPISKSMGSDSSSSSSAITTTTPNGVVGTPDSGVKQRNTWVTPYVAAWQDAYGGAMPIGPALKPLGKLRADHGDDDVLRAWVGYLEATDGQYANPARFAATYGEWAGTHHRRADGDQPLHEVAKGDGTTMLL